MQYHAAGGACVAPWTQSWRSRTRPEPATRSSNEHVPGLGRRWGGLEPATLMPRRDEPEPVEICFVEWRVRPPVGLLSSMRRSLCCSTFPSCCRVTRTTHRSGASSAPSWFRAWSSGGSGQLATRVAVRTPLGTVYGGLGLSDGRASRSRDNPVGLLVIGAGRDPLCTTSRTSRASCGSSCLS